MNRGGGVYHENGRNGNRVSGGGCCCAGMMNEWECRGSFFPRLLGVSKGRGGLLVNRDSLGFVVS